MLAELGKQGPWSVLQPARVDSDAGVKFQIETGGSIFADRKPRNGKDTYRVTVKNVPGDITGLRLEVLADAEFAGPRPRLFGRRRLCAE